MYVGISALIWKASLYPETLNYRTTNILN